VEGRRFLAFCAMQTISVQTQNVDLTARRSFIERIIRKSESAPERTVLILTLLTVEKAPLSFVPYCYQFVTLSHRRITKHLLGNKHGRASRSHYTVMPDLQDTDGACVR
jgi:hypothetical protein